METLADWNNEPDPARLVARVPYRMDQVRRCRLLGAELLRRWGTTHELFRHIADVCDSHPDPIADILDLVKRLGREAELDRTIPREVIRAVPRWAALYPVVTLRALVVPDSSGVLALLGLHRHTTASRGLAAVTRVRRDLASLVRDVFIPPRTLKDARPFHKRFPARWLTGTVTALAHHIWDTRDFTSMPILADALQDAGCDAAHVLTHCRDPQQLHCRGCWVVDAILDHANTT